MTKPFEDLYDKFFDRFGFKLHGEFNRYYSYLPDTDVAAWFRRLENDIKEYISSKMFLIIIISFWAGYLMAFTVFSVLGILQW